MIVYRICRNRGNLGGSTDGNHNREDNEGENENDKMKEIKKNEGSNEKMRMGDDHIENEEHKKRGEK